MLTIIAIIVVGLVAAAAVGVMAVAVYRRGSKLQAVIYGATAVCIAMTATFSSGAEYYAQKAEFYNQKTQKILRELKNR